VRCILHGAFIDLQMEKVYSAALNRTHRMKIAALNVADTGTSVRVPPIEQSSIKSPSTLFKETAATSYASNVTFDITIFLFSFP
jgi:hypothetical protein